MPGISALKEMKAIGDFGGLHDAIPYAAFMGLSLAADPDMAGQYITTMRFDESLIGNVDLPALHGGTISALLEMAALFQLTCDIEPEIMPKVVTITIDYMRSGGPNDTYAVASASRIGRRVANLRAEAWQEDRTRLIAAANINFLLA